MNSSEDDSLNINSKLDSLCFIVAKMYQLDFMINDSAIVYFERVINDFPDSKFRYQSMIALNDIKLDDNWKNYLVTEYPDSTYISDSSYKEINIIDEIHKESFIDNEINRLELLDTFSTLFINENDSISIVDTTNIKLDTLNKVFEINEQ